MLSTSSGRLVLEREVFALVNADCTLPLRVTVVVVMVDNVVVGESRGLMVLDRQEVFVGRFEEIGHGFLEEAHDVAASDPALVDAEGKHAEVDRATGRFAVFKDLRWWRKIVS